MKTLDEVIKAFEICGYDTFCKKCPYAVNVAPHPYSHEDYRCSEGKDDDALHYLREYRHWQDVMEETPSYYEFVKMQNSWEERQKNEPLTWDELKTMEGKPVWVEYLRDGETYDAEWCIVKDIDDDLLHDTEGYGYGRANKYGDGYGVGWQAYRKERTE